MVRELQCNRPEWRDQGNHRGNVTQAERHGHEPAPWVPSDDAQFAIQKGKIEGDKITLEADHDGHTIRFDLVLADNRISGDVSMSVEGQTAKAKIDVTRAK